MISIDLEKIRDGWQFNIKLTDVRKTFRAKNIREVTQAVNHYFVLGHHTPGSRPKVCPLCRDVTP